MTKNIIQTTLDEIYDQCEESVFNGDYGDSLKSIVSDILFVYDEGREVSEVEFQMEMLIEDIETLMVRLSKAVATKVRNGENLHTETMEKP